MRHLRRYQRETYIPKGAMKFGDRQSSAIVYAHESRPGWFSLMGFSGKRCKPDFHYRYPTAAKREAKAREFFESVRAREAYRVERREQRKAQGHKLKVGSILRCSWGYDQTNIDYFEVVRLIGSKMVEIVEIAQESVGEWTGKCVPLPGKHIGKPMRKLAQGDSVKIYSFAHAYLVEPQIVGGVPVYGTSSWTAYA